MSLFFSFFVSLLNILTTHALLTRKRSNFYCVVVFCLNSLFIICGVLIAKKYILNPTVLKYALYFFAFTYIAYIHIIFTESISKKLFTMFSIWLFSTSAFFFVVSFAKIWLEVFEEEYIRYIIFSVRICLQIFILLVVNFWLNKPYKEVISLIPDKTMNFMLFYPIIAFLLLINNQTAIFGFFKNFNYTFEMLSFLVFIIIGYLLIFAGIASSSKVISLTKIKAELRSQKELLETVIENIPDPFAIYDKNSNLIKMNAAGRKLYPLQKETIAVMLPYRDSEYFDLDGNEVLPENLPIRRAFRGEIVRNAVFVIKQGASERFTEVNATPIYDSNNNLVSLVSYQRDITEMILNQKEIKKNIELQMQIKLEKDMARLDRLSLVGEMAASIGHEVRSPMTTVRGFLQLLSTKKECAKYNDYYALMIDELDRANSIITEFLALAKDKVVIDKEVLSLKVIVEKIFPLIQAEGLTSDMNIQLELEEVDEISLDKKEMHQLILNLVQNASQAMSPGGTMKIRTFMTDLENVLAVQDDGGGISKEVLEKIGTPFFTTKESGTGLGLAICYSIAARHNAKIDIQTSPKGTTFFVRFKK